MVEITFIDLVMMKITFTDGFLVKITFIDRLNIERAVVRLLLLMGWWLR